MASIPFAFSVHHFISSVGADAGFAAIIGLAILVFLYFAQARETAALRDRAEESAERVQQLETRVAQLSGSAGATSSTTAPAGPAPPGARSPATPAPAIAAAHTGSAAPVAAASASRTAPSAPSPPVRAPVVAPSAPAGVGAPALSSATRLIPAPDRDDFTTHSNGGAAGATVLTPAGATPATGPPAPPPATAAGGANGATTGRTGGSGVSTTMPPPTGAPRPAARPGVPRSASSPRRPGGPVSPRGTGSGSGGSRSSRGFIVLGVLLGVVAVVVVVLIVTSGGGSSSSASSASASAANASPRTRSGGAGAVKPASVTVAVLNGTSTSNLAHNVGQQLVGSGFKEGNIATAADQTQTATVVGYLPGQRAAALLVARSLKLGSASVQPVDQSSRTVACPSTPCTAQVVVTVGSDLGSTP